MACFVNFLGGSGSFPNCKPLGNMHILLCNRASLAGSLAGVICTFIMLFTGRMYQGLLLLGAALLCLGLGILLFKLTIQCVKLMATGTVKTFVACKHALVGKEDTNEK